MYVLGPTCQSGKKEKKRRACRQLSTEGGERVWRGEGWGREVKLYEVLSGTSSFHFTGRRLLLTTRIWFNANSSSGGSLSNRRQFSRRVLLYSHSACVAIIVLSLSVSGAACLRDIIVQFPLFVRSVCFVTLVTVVYAIARLRMCLRV